MSEDEISNTVIGLAIEVHRALGPGLLESIYQKCLGRELELSGLHFREEVPLPVKYKGLEFDAAFRLDMIVADKVILELKPIEVVLPVHEAQLLSYLRLSGLKLGEFLCASAPLR